MDVEPGPAWADALSKILRMGKNNPETNKILSKAKKDHEKRDKQDSDDDNNDDDSVNVDDDETETKQSKSISTCITKKLKPDPQRDALLENELKEAATRGVVHLFNAVKTVNSKSDKKKKKKKKKKMKIKKRRTIK